MIFRARKLISETMADWIITQTRIQVTQDLGTETVSLTITIGSLEPVTAKFAVAALEDNPGVVRDFLSQTARTMTRERIGELP